MGAKLGYGVQSEIFMLTHRITPLKEAFKSLIKCFVTCCESFKHFPLGSFSESVCILETCEMFGGHIKLRAMGAPTVLPFRDLWSCDDLKV